MHYVRAMRPNNSAHAYIAHMAAFALSLNPIMHCMLAEFRFLVFVVLFTEFF